MRDLTGWAAEAAERALAGFSAVDSRAMDAVIAAKAWAQGAGTAKDSQDAAFAAQQAAREAQDLGYSAQAMAIRAAALAAASAGEPDLAHDAAAVAIDAIEQNSAACEREFNVGTERRQQWEGLPIALQQASPEPPSATGAACSVD